MLIMKAKMLNLQRYFSVRATGLLFVLLVLRLGLTTARADAVSELASFSIFGKADLVQLAKSDAKTAHGPPMSNPRFLAVQSCYVVLGRCAGYAIEKLRVERYVRSTALRSCRSVCSGERRSKRIVARARENPQSVFRVTWSHRYWTRRWIAQAGIVLGASRCG